MKRLNLLSLAAPLFITACVPVYQPVNSNKTVIIDSLPETDLKICKNNDLYRLEKDTNGYVHVPYGRRISIVSYYINSNTEFMTLCSPEVSFVPKAGNKYYIDFIIKEDKCKLDVLRYSKQSKMGMIPEESVSNEHACLPLNE